MNNRNLNLEKAKLKHIKTSLELSNFLWMNDVSVEIQTNIVPDIKIGNYVDKLLQLKNIELENILYNHPKLASLDYKIKSLEVERKLQKNNLLPQIDLQYNFFDPNSRKLKHLKYRKLQRRNNRKFSTIFEKRTSKFKID